MGAHGGPHINGATGLVGAWDAADLNSYPGSGTAWTDIVGSANGTLTNGPTFDTGNGGSLKFDGVNDYVDTGNAFQSTFRSSFSVELWAKPDDGQPGTIDFIFGTGNADESARLHLYVPRTDGGITFHFEVGSDEVSGTSSAILSDGQETWHLFSFTIVSGGTATFYMDGVSRCTGDASGITMSSWTSSDEVFVGSADNNGSPESNAFDGNIATTRIYEKALSSREVLQNYNAHKGRFGL